MKKKYSLKQRAEKIPTEVKLMVKKSMATARKINSILIDQGKSQKDLADLLGKKESEISKWLQGTHNFTYKTICKIEAVLGEEIIITENNNLPSYFIIQPFDIKNESINWCTIKTTKNTQYTSLKNNNLSFQSNHNLDDLILDQQDEIQCCSVN